VTDIYLAGGENPTHQRILSECGAMRVAVNVTSLLRRRTMTWSLDFPYQGWEWVAYCDGPSNVPDLNTVLNQASKPPKYVVGPEGWAEHPSYLPMWNGEGDMPNLPEGLVVTDRVFKHPALLRRTLASRRLGKVLGAVTGSIGSDIGRFDLIISGAWWSAMKWGETQVWDGTEMHRYNADFKSEVRTRHYDHIDALGVDPETVLLGDPDEAAKLAVYSWIAYEESLSRARVLTMNNSVSTIDIEGDEGETGPDLRLLDTAPPQPRHKTLLPVVGTGSLDTSYRHQDGNEVIESHAIVTSVSGSIRQCDNCYLATAGCPAFQAQSSCAYEIPVSIQTKDQLQQVLQVMIEMQTQRVLMARFAEEISGQELSPEFGRELDRLFASVEKFRDIMDNRDSVKVTMEAKGRAGVLSRLFGSTVGTNAKVLSRPIDSEAVVEATLVDD
jgi:hypothetical protein